MNLSILFFVAFFAAVASVIVSGAVIPPVQFPNGQTASFANPSQLTGYWANIAQTNLAPGNYQWALSLADPSITAAGGTVCTPNSYMSQTGCDTTFPTFVGATATSNSIIKFQYGSTSSGLTWLSTVLCTCDATATNLVAPSNSYAASQDATGKILLEWNVNSAGCCPDAGPAPPATPTPGGPTAVPGPAPPPEEEKGGLTWGGVFLIIFFVPLGLYVIIFIAWNYKQGKTGRDLAPHPDFWGALPGLFKDGITWTWSKIRGQPWTPSESSSSSGGDQSAAGGNAGTYTSV